MIRTNLTKPAWAGEAWDWAVKEGRWTVFRGRRVLQLGQADYVLYDGVIYSVNGDLSNTWNQLPFGIRWALTADDIARGSGGTAIDALAIEQFRLEGLI
jgi:hypothetical protein